MSASDAAYLVTATLVGLGLLGLVQTPNLLRKLMALNILQVAVIVFFILLGHKTGAAPPTAPHGGEELRASDRFARTCSTPTAARYGSRASTCRPGPSRPPDTRISSWRIRRWPAPAR